MAKKKVGNKITLENAQKMYKEKALTGQKTSMSIFKSRMCTTDYHAFKDWAQSTNPK
jgi:hypothetical protein